MSDRIEKLRERNRACREGKFQYEDAGWMREAYWGRGLSLREVAAEAESSLRTVARWMAKHGIETDSNRMPVRTGESNPNWRGGRNVCPSCDGQKSWTSEVCMDCLDRSGSANPRWLEGDASYPVAHGRVRAVRGPASTHPCAMCSTREAQHWAYDHTDPEQLSGPDKPGRPARPYSINPSHYLPMCAACHKKFDLERVE